MVNEFIEKMQRDFKQKKIKKNWTIEDFVQITEEILKCKNQNYEPRIKKETELIVSDLKNQFLIQA